MKVDEVIGLRVAEARRAAGWTQSQLGERLAAWLPGGWQRQIVHNGEQGRRPWSTAEVVVLAHVLGLSLPDLLMPPVQVASYTLPGGQVRAADVLRGGPPADEQAMLLDALAHDLGKGARAADDAAARNADVRAALDAARRTLGLIERDDHSGTGR